MTISSYRQVAALSGTGLVKLARSPKHYREYVDYPQEPTAAMQLGTAVHTMVLEMSTFSSQYAIFLGEGTRASKEYKAFAASNVGKTILKQDELDTISACVTALRENPLAKRLLWDEPGLNEHELHWQENGVPCKGKLDRWLPEKKIVVDLKTASDASEAAFNQWKAKSMGYYLQAAHYQSGLRDADGVVPAFLFVVVETEAPYGVAIYELSQEKIDEAHEQRKELLETYKRCMETGVWSGYPQEIRKI